MTSGFTKLAWVRDPDVPPGRPALGRINCPCGEAPLSMFGDGKDVVCQCGVVYDSRGWIIRDLARDSDLLASGARSVDDALSGVCPDGPDCEDAKCRRLRDMVKVRMAGK